MLTRSVEQALNPKELPDHYQRGRTRQESKPGPKTALLLSPQLRFTKNMFDASVQLAVSWERPNRSIVQFAMYNKHCPDNQPGTRSRRLLSIKLGEKKTSTQPGTRSRRLGLETQRFASPWFLPGSSLGPPWVLPGFPWFLPGLPKTDPEDPPITKTRRGLSTMSSTLP